MQFDDPNNECSHPVKAVSEKCLVPVCGAQILCHILPANSSFFVYFSGHGQTGDSRCVFDEEGTEEAKAADTA